MSWLQDKAIGINKMLNSNGAKQTEMLIERQEKIIDQLDKKRKVRNLNVKTIYYFTSRDF
jgi:hypothetical protein